MPRPKLDPKEAKALGTKTSRKSKAIKPQPPNNPQETTPKTNKKQCASPPIWLGTSAKQVWNTELPKINLHPAKLNLFAGYCAHLGRAIDLEKALKKKGTGKQLANDTFGKHGEVNAAAKEWKSAMDLATKLGITGLMNGPADNDTTTIVQEEPVNSEVIDEEDEFILGGPRPQG